MSRVEPHCSDYKSSRSFIARARVTCLIDAPTLASSLAPPPHTRQSSAMASMSRVFLLLAFSAAMVSLASARPYEGSSAAMAECGEQAAGAVCLFGACCSKDGMCGRGDECGPGCQSGPCTTAVASTAECGKQADDADCWPRSLCCSADGMCGTGDAYCGSGCQGGSCYRTPSNLQ